MSIFIDQLGNNIRLSSIPKRIISLVPSQTELLFDLGLDESVIGITKFCIHPNEWFKNKTRIGGTKNVNIEKIISLQPDLIIANKEENVKEQIEALQQIAPVWVSDVNNLSDALSMISSIGELTGKITEAKELINNIGNAFNQLSAINNQPSTAYLIWREPFMSVGGDTFINDMMQRCGFRNIFDNEHRYPEITIEQLKTSGCELLLLSSEPYPFTQKHIDELQLHLPQTKIMLVDGEMFSWYGSRLQYAPHYFQHLIKQLME